MTATPSPQPTQQPRPEVSDATLRASARRFSELCRRFCERVDARLAEEAATKAQRNDETA